MLSKKEILEQLRLLLPLLNREYSVSRIGLFGSFGRDEGKEDSDIDLMVSLDRPIGWKFFTLQILLEEKLGKKVDLITEKALRDELRDQIMETIEYVQ